MNQQIRNDVFAGVIGLVIGAAVVAAVLPGRNHNEAIKPHEETYRANVADTAIVNFGIVSVNPPWLIMVMADGRPITDTIPDDATQVILRSAHEPIVEKAEEGNVWTIKFK